MPDNRLDSILIGSMTPGADGKIHVKYAYVDDKGERVNPSSTTATVFDAAFQEWSSKASITGVLFDIAGPNDPAQISLAATDDSTRNGGCLAMNPNIPSYLNFGSTFAQLAAQDPESAKAGAKHEISHFLGLDDIAYEAGVVSISSKNGGSCSSPLLRTKNVQDGDASKSKDCIQKARSLEQTGDGGGGADYQWVQYNPPCYAFWNAYDIYTWNDGWHYVGTLYLLDSVVCA